MAIAQGINKIISGKKQTGLGTPATGSGGQIFRREKCGINLKKDTFDNNEIVSHQQSTGITHGLRKVDGTLDGLLSPGTYSTLIGSLLRSSFAVGGTTSAATLTIAGTGPTYTITLSAGSFLTDGHRIGDVVRITVGSFNAANINKNLLITALTATVMTVRTLNGSAMVAEGPVFTATIGAVGKKSKAPLSGHTVDYWTFEEWSADISKSELYTDCMIASCDANLPSTGNATLSFGLTGLNRTLNATQQLTSPTAETTTPVLTAVNGMVMLNGAVLTNITGASIKIDGSIQNIGAVIGSNLSPDLYRGRVKVSGQITVLYQDQSLSTLFDNATNTSMVLVITNDSTATSDFVSFSLGQIKLGGDDADDGEKALVQTIPFTASINTLGGAGLANDKTILTIQDSQA